MNGTWSNERITLEELVEIHILTLKQGQLDGFIVISSAAIQGQGTITIS